MTIWPRSLLARLLLVVLAGLLLANALSLTLVMVERMHSARTVMLGNLENDVATSVAILDRLPASERAAGCRGLNEVTIVISWVQGNPAQRRRISVRRTPSEP